MARTRVVVRRNGRVVGQVVYGSEAEAVRHAATMQREASGLEALLAPAAPATNRKPRRNGKPSDATLRAVGRYVKSVNPDEVEYAKEAGYGTGDLALGKYTYNIYGDAEAAWAELVAHVKASSPRRRNPMTKQGAVAQVGGLLKRAGVPIYKKATRHEAGRDGVTVRLGFRKGTIDVVSHSRNAAAFMADVVRATEAAGWRVIFDNIAGGAVSLAPPLAKNPSIGRGTKHRDIVAHAVEERLREEGVPKREARSRGYAIATASEKARRRGKVYVSRLRANPTPIDIASLEFQDFAKTVVIDSQYNVRSGRRFARVISKDGTFVTDVPVADGQGSGAKGAKAIKQRAWEQLRIHLQPSNWKPSVRVNPAGSVAYGGTSIRIHNGTYQVQPHGPSFQGPDGFVRAKAWIDQHGA
jgi:hypothetical protein